MLFRDEMRERICNARTVTERKVNRTLREKGVRLFPILLRCTRKHPNDIVSLGCFPVAGFEPLCNEEAVNRKEHCKTMRRNSERFA